MSGTQLPNKRHLSAAAENEYLGSSATSSIGDEELRSRSPQIPRQSAFRLSRLLSIMNPRRRNNEQSYDYHVAPSEEPSDENQKPEPAYISQSPRKSKWLRILKRVAFYLPLSVLALFGLLHILMVILGQKSLFWDVQEYEKFLPDWGKSGHAGDGLAHYPTDATRNVRPIPCHSHNDYWRKVPLFDAIHAGCISVEADVWLFKERDELYVGHGTASLTPERTFASLYIHPLVELLDTMNPRTDFSDTNGHGVFDEDPNQTLVLLIDFKTNGHDLFPRVRQELEPLRANGYLSFWDGDKFNSRAVTAVGTGNTPFDLIVANTTHRDIFFDAPLDEMWEDPSDDTDDASASPPTIAGRGQGKTGTESTTADDFNTSNSYYASASLQAHIGFPITGKLSSGQMDKLRGQIRGAKRKGLLSRYWETPIWPTSLRNHIWQMLVEEGVDILNVDDLKAAAKMDWRVPITHDWIDA